MLRKMFAEIILRLNTPTEKFFGKGGELALSLSLALYMGQQKGRSPANGVDSTQTIS